MDEARSLIKGFGLDTRAVYNAVKEVVDIISRHPKGQEKMRALYGQYQKDTIDIVIGRATTVTEIDPLSSPRRIAAFIATNVASKVNHYNGYALASAVIKERDRCIKILLGGV